MDNTKCTNLEVNDKNRDQRRAFRDRCAIAAMQSLIQVYAILDEEGDSHVAYEDPMAFRSAAGIAMYDGWGNPQSCSIASLVAGEAYSIARAMLVARDEEDYMEDDEDFEEKLNKDDDEKTTEETAGS